MNFQSLLNSVLLRLKPQVELRMKEKWEILLMRIQ